MAQFKPRQKVVLRRSPFDIRCQLRQVNDRVVLNIAIVALLPYPKFAQRQTGGHRRWHRRCARARQRHEALAGDHRAQPLWGRFTDICQHPVERGLVANRRVLR